MIYIIIIFMCFMFMLIVANVLLLELIKTSNNHPTTNQNINIYTKKNLLTETELEFYKKMHSLKNDYYIVPQVCLSSIINKSRGLDKKKSRYINELFKIVDFGIFDKNFCPLLLIELNDKSHNQIDRKDRDLKVKKLCNDANIRLITFYTTYPNEEKYVVERIKKEIG